MNVHILIRVIQNDDPKQFDALCEHKSWCAWVASYGRSSFSPVGNTAIKDDNQTGGEVPPGWRRLLTYLLPKPASHSEPWKVLSVQPIEIFVNYSKIETRFCFLSILTTNG